MTTLAISDNGRVLIPSEMREQLGVKPREKLFAEIKDGVLTLTPMKQHFAQMREYFDRFVKIEPGRSLADELIADRRLEAAKE